MDTKQNYTEINSKTISRWVDEGWEWGTPIDHETYEKAQLGQWQVLLTPTKPVPREWFGSLAGKSLLGLASGGGQQMPVFSAAGAKCTVLDYSDRQLDSERLVAEREGYAIDIVKADMTKPLPFPDESFDIIFHPVSNCYVEDVLPIWRECFRVLKKGGRLLAGLDNGLSYAYEDDGEHWNRLPYNPLKDPELLKRAMEQDDGIQFSHTVEEQIGGQLKAGFRLVDIYGDTNGVGKLHELNVPTFWATLAVKEY